MTSKSNSSIPSEEFRHLIYQKAELKVFTDLYLFMKSFWKGYEKESTVFESRKISSLSASDTEKSWDQ